MDPNDKTLWCFLNLLWVLCLMYMCGGGCCIMRSITEQKKNHHEVEWRPSNLCREVYPSLFVFFFFFSPTLSASSRTWERTADCNLSSLPRRSTHIPRSKAWNKHHHSLQLAVPFCLAGICVKWRLHIRWCVREREGERKGQRKMSKKMSCRWNILWSVLGWGDV